MRMRMWKRVAFLLSLLVVSAALYMTPLFGNKPAVIVSGSMEPAIKTGALVLIHFSDFEDCEVGDVITYYHPGFNELITHRIVEKGEDYYWTQGDANQEHDNISVIKDNFYGKVVYIANWVSPLLQNWIVDRQFDRMALMSALLVVGLCCGVVIVLVSLASTYLRSVLFVAKKSGYQTKELNRLYTIGRTMMMRCYSHKSLTFWKRVKLNLAYRVWRRTMLDIEDELKHIEK